MARTETACPVCGSDSVPLTRHHLVPKSKSNSRKEADEPSNILMVCRACHDGIHALFTDAELKKSRHTLADLMADEKFAKFAAWRQKHPDNRGASKAANRKNGRP